MPLPAIALIAVAFGVAAAAAAANSKGQVGSSSGGPGAPGTSPSEGQGIPILLVSDALFPAKAVSPPALAGVEKAMVAAGYSWSEWAEKFRDPRIDNCWGVDGNPNPYATRQFEAHDGYDAVIVGPPLPNGLEWIGEVPPTAAERTARLRARVEEFALAPSVQVQAQADASAKALYIAAQGLAVELSSPSGRTAAAKRLGVPLDTLATTEEQIAAFLQKYTRLDFRSLIRDLNEAAVALLVRIVRELVDVASKAITAALGAGAAAIGAFASTLGSWVPIVKALWDQFLAESAKRDAAIAESRKRWFEANVSKGFSELADYGYPVPPHLLDTYSADFPGAGETLYQTPAQEAIAERLRLDLEDWRAVGIVNAAPAVRWWQQSIALMSDPTVQSVFRALGRDSLGGWFASDDQVAMVGVPIAVSTGADPWEFTRLLWGYARGWRALEALGKARPVRIPHWTCPSSSWWEKAKGCEIDGYSVFCKDAPSNAAILQWCDLSRTAWELSLHVGKAIGTLQGVAVQAAGVPVKARWI